MLAVSYNPGYQSVLKDLKPSTRQRFVALSFAYPDPEREAAIVAREGNVSPETARALVKLGTMTRGLKDSGLAEGASTRLLIQAGKLMGLGIDVRAACHHGITEPLTDDPELLQAIDEMVSSVF
jgi:nitric oxide reductase NorQ protein